MPTLRRRNPTRRRGPGAPALVAGRRRLGGRGPRRLGRRRRLPRPLSRRPFSGSPGRSRLAGLADPGRDRALEPARAPASTSSSPPPASPPASSSPTPPATAARARGRTSSGSRRRRSPTTPSAEGGRRRRGEPGPPGLHPHLRRRAGRRRHQGRSRDRTAGLADRRRTRPRSQEIRRERPPAAAAPTSPGPAAIAVARKFAGAFVLYETGRDTAAVKTAFHATATPELAKALLKRPPRLPADVKVPKAKVLNIVAGPKHGDTYTLSVSLLRVGVTSELRLDMQKTPSGNSPNAAGTRRLGQGPLARHGRAGLMKRLRGVFALGTPNSTRHRLRRGLRRPRRAGTARRRRRAGAIDGRREGSPAPSSSTRPGTTPPKVKSGLPRTGDARPRARRLLQAPAAAAAPT